MVEEREHLLGIAPGEADQGLALHNSLGFLEGGLDHKLVQRCALKLRRLLQSVSEFRRDASRDAAFGSNCRWHSVIWSGAILTPVYDPVGGLATKMDPKWNRRKESDR